MHFKSNFPDFSLCDLPFLKTSFKLMVTIQSGCVPEILTLCRIHKMFFRKYHEKAFIQSFPTLYNTMGSKVDGLAVKSKFLQKTALKTAFLRDTKLDQVTLEGAGTPNFKSTDIFDMFPENLGAKAFR